MPRKRRRNSDPEGFLHKVPLSPELTIAKRPKIETSQPNHEKHEKISKIVQREFDIEIKNKEKELEIVNERLSQARLLIDHLRYAVVQKYYKEQESKVTDTEAALIRGQPLLEHEDKGPQMPLHPSVRKLLGKKPKSLSDLMRVTPQRAAAQTAKTTISQRINPKNTKESRLMQKIRKEGIVIDHSILGEEASIESHKFTSATIKEESEVSEAHPIVSTTTTTTTSQSLNASRLNNKTKHLLVVGNTSKYIGGKAENERTEGHKYSHKWLVYVQYKDSNVEISNFVKMVRFHLHPSYRPSDVVDVSVPPFQICRHGWGEFPMRIQIFFHDCFNEKPLQLIHNLVLDKMHTGLQTMGAETVVEIWLRGQMDSKVNAASANFDTMSSLASKLKPRTISFTQNKDDLEDNLFDFLTNIGEMPANVCADIDKIEPTVLVTEPLDGFKVEASPTKTQTAAAISIVNSLSPTKVPPSSVSPMKVKNGCTLEKLNATPSAATSESITPDTHAVVKSTSNVLVRAPIAPSTLTSASNTIPKMSTDESTPEIPQLVRTVPEFKRNIIFNKVEKMILPITKNDKVSTPNIQVTTVTSSASTNDVASSSAESKKLLQKKLVPVVDSTGKVKYLQMLVAVSMASTQTALKPSVPTIATASMNGQCEQSNSVSFTETTKATKAATTIAKSKAMTKTTAIAVAPVMSDKSKAIAPLPAGGQLTKHRPEFAEVIIKEPKLLSSSNHKKVFQKEGKLFIIDPVQMRLKKQQKQQVSLLKPQVSLLKQQIKQTANVVMGDHDYAPNKSGNNSAPSPRISIVESLPSNKGTSYNLSDQLRMQRQDFERKFYQQSFGNVRSAVEYLLRRLPLVASKGTSTSYFPFVYDSMQSFQLLSAFKQRSCEWLRAKFIIRCIHSHRDFRESKDPHWTTREILIFSRTHGYTPKIKLLKPSTVCGSSTNGENVSHFSQNFTDLVRKELMNEEQTRLITLSTNSKISSWLNEMLKRLQQYEFINNDREIIDVDTWEDEKTKKKSNSTKLYQSHSVAERATHDYVLLKPPDTLATEIDLLKNINKNLDICWEPEEISPQVFMPSVEIALAKCLQVFISQLAHRGKAAKLDGSSVKGNQNRSVEAFINEAITISNYDLGKAIMSAPELDFLTQMHFGVSKQNIKTEKNL